MGSRPGGFEPPTRGLEIRCSSPLSYGRLVKKIIAERDEMGEVLKRDEGCKSREEVNKKTLGLFGAEEE